MQGRRFKPPFPLTFHPNQGPAFVELTPELKEWIKARGVDLLLHLGETNWDMKTLGMQEEFAGQLNEWETTSPEKVVGLFAKKDADHLVRDEVPASSFGHSYRGEYGAVTAFKTRRNTMGVYQIQGMGNINRRGVGIRYKLVLETLELPAARLRELQLKANEGSLPTTEAETKRKLTQAKMEYLKYLALGVVMFAEKNNGSLPKDLRESFSYPGTDAPAGFLPDLFELVCQGRMSEIKNAAHTIIIREKDPVKTWDRQWMKCYAFADGHVEVHVELAGQFEAWEKATNVFASVHTSGKDALAWKLALARDHELDAKREVAMYEVQLSCFAKVNTTPGSAAKTSEADKETERIKKDIADAKVEAVSVGEEIARLEEMLKQPGEPSGVAAEVPLATQLSEAVRAETAARKEIVDLESLSAPP